MVLFISNGQALAKINNNNITTTGLQEKPVLGVPNSDAPTTEPTGEPEPTNESIREVIKVATEPWPTMTLTLEPPTSQPTDTITITSTVVVPTATDSSLSPVVTSTEIAATGTPPTITATATTTTTPEGTPVITTTATATRNVTTPTSTNTPIVPTTQPTPTLQPTATMPPSTNTPTVPTTQPTSTQQPTVTVPTSTSTATVPATQQPTVTTATSTSTPRPTYDYSGDYYDPFADDPSRLTPVGQGNEALPTNTPMPEATVTTSYEAVPESEPTSTGEPTAISYSIASTSTLTTSVEPTQRAAFENDFYDPFLSGQTGEIATDTQLLAETEASQTQSIALENQSTLTAIAQCHQETIDICHLVFIALHYGSYDTIADMNDDEVVDVQDLMMMINRYNQSARGNLK